MNKSQTIELPQISITYREDGIIHLNYNDGVLSLKESKEIFKIIRDNCPWEISPIYATGNAFSSFDNESRIFWGSEEVTKHCSAIAMLTNTLGFKLLGRFFISIAKPSVKTKIFNTEKEAIEWLQKFETKPKPIS